VCRKRAVLVVPVKINKAEQSSGDQGKREMKDLPDVKVLPR